MSSLLYNGNIYFDSLKRNANRAKIVDVSLFYDSLSFTRSEELPNMSAFILLGSIGGNLGLFLGISVLSICEVFGLLLEIMFIFRKRR